MIMYDLVLKRKGMANMNNISLGSYKINCIVTYIIKIGVFIIQRNEEFRLLERCFRFFNSFLINN